MAECTKDERNLLDALKKASVISPSGYSNNKGELLFYRMRLFSPEQRSVLRKALARPVKGDTGFLGIRGGSGMLDELEMVRYEVHGRSIGDIKRTF